MSKDDDIDIDIGVLAPPLPDDASAPPPDDLPSYDNCYPTTDNSYAPPPPPIPPPSFEEAINDASTWLGGNILTAEQVLGALSAHIDRNCCWGKGPMSGMQIECIEPSTAYKYLINTWNERRKCEWTSRPYDYGPVDGPFNGPPPGVWQIPCQRPAPFEQETYKLPVPHTEELRPCWRCHGHRRIRCTTCHGRGHSDCHSCTGGRKADGERCGMCNGNGRRRCTRCHGRGHIRCHTCNGSGQLVHYLLVTVDFKDHDDDYVYEKTDLPDKLILKAGGEKLLDETAFRIGAIFNFHVEEINKESAHLVHKHATKWPEELTHMQKHSLHSVPVSEVRYKLEDGETGRFWVYGEERSVYSYDYPAQCCCCFVCHGCCDNCACCNSCTIL